MTESLSLRERRPPTEGRLDRSAAQGFERRSVKCSLTAWSPN
jgi:hypothetical protein